MKVRQAKNLIKIAIVFCLTILSSVVTLNLVNKYFSHSQNNDIYGEVSAFNFDTGIPDYATYTNCSEFTIGSKTGLDNFRTTLTKDPDNWTFKDKTVKLTDDIDLAGVEWKPIGQGSSNYVKSIATKKPFYQFHGVFDGQYHKISNMRTKTGLDVMSNKTNIAGLFASIGMTDYNYHGVYCKAGVKNIIIDKPIFTVQDVVTYGTSGYGTYYVGAVAAFASGNVFFDTIQVLNPTFNQSTDSYLKGSIGDVRYYAGGILGGCIDYSTANITITNCEVQNVSWEMKKVVNSDFNHEDATSVNIFESVSLSGMGPSYAGQESGYYPKNVSISTCVVKGGNYRSGNNSGRYLTFGWDDEDYIKSATSVDLNSNGCINTANKNFDTLAEAMDNDVAASAGPDKDYYGKTWFYCPPYNRVEDENGFNAFPTLTAFLQSPIVTYTFRIMDIYGSLEVVDQNEPYLGTTDLDAWFNEDSTDIKKQINLPNNNETYLQENTNPFVLNAFEIVAKSEYDMLKWEKTILEEEICYWFGPELEIFTLEFDSLSYYSVDEVGANTNIQITTVVNGVSKKVVPSPTIIAGNNPFSTCQELMFEVGYGTKVERTTKQENDFNITTYTFVNFKDGLVGATEQKHISVIYKIPKLYKTTFPETNYIYDSDEIVNIDIERKSNIMWFQSSEGSTASSTRWIVYYGVDLNFTMSKEGVTFEIEDSRYVKEINSSKPTTSTFTYEGIYNEEKDVRWELDYVEINQDKFTESGKIENIMLDNVVAINAVFKTFYKVEFKQAIDSEGVSNNATLSLSENPILMKNGKALKAYFDYGNRAYVYEYEGEIVARYILNPFYRVIDNCIASQGLTYISKHSVVQPLIEEYSCELSFEINENDTGIAELVNYSQPYVLEYGTQITFETKLEQNVLTFIYKITYYDTEIATIKYKMKDDDWVLQSEISNGERLWTTCLGDTSEELSMIVIEGDENILIKPTFELKTYEGEIS